jgi:DNA polymerase-3 subunit epsilon
MARFLAIDFETANEDRANACALGWAVVDRGTIAESGWTPLDPEIAEADWSVFHSNINGFTPADVRGAPTFDLSVLRAELGRYGIVPDPLHYACSALIARAAWPALLSVALPLVERHLGIPRKERDPGENARASAMITLSAMAALDQSDLDGAIPAADLVWGAVAPDLSWTACGIPHRHVRAADVHARTSDHDPNHPFFRQTVVFTGALASMTRRQAFQRLVDVGGQPGNGVTIETNVLVVGDQDIRRLAVGESMSAKQRKALALRATGQDIQLIGEDDFVRSL